MQTCFIFLTYPPFKLNVFDTTGPRALYIYKNQVVFDLFCHDVFFFHFWRSKHSQHGFLAKTIEIINNTAVLFIIYMAKTLSKSHFM